MEKKLQKTTQLRIQSKVNAYRCGACGETEHLDQCNACRLISYCSERCKNKQSKQHKAICSAARQILIFMGGKSTIFDAHRHEYTESIGAERLRKSILSMSNKLVDLMGRNLDTEEYSVSIPVYLFKKFQLNHFT